MSWANAGLAGAFVLGAIGGSAATIRVMRHVLGYVRREQREQRDE